MVDGPLAHLHDGVLHGLEEERGQGVVLAHAQGVEVLLPPGQVGVLEQLVQEALLGDRDLAQEGGDEAVAPGAAQEDGGEDRQEFLLVQQTAVHPEGQGLRHLVHQGPQLGQPRLRGLGRVRDQGGVPGPPCLPPPG